MNSAQMMKKSSRATTVFNRRPHVSPVRPTLHICYAKDQSNNFFNGPKFSKKVHDFFKDKKDLIEKHHTKQGNLVREWLDKEMSFAKELLDCEEDKETKQDKDDKEEYDDDTKEVTLDSRKSDDEFIVDGIVIESKQ